jgi:amino acid adenylation domain-containing protein
VTTAQSRTGVAESTPSTRTPSAPVPGVRPLGQAQRGLWFLDNFNPGSSFYVISTGLRLRGPLDVAALRTALNDCVARQDALRTRFVTLDGFPYQVFVPPSELELPVVEASDLDPAAAEDFIRERCDLAATTPFDLAAEPLLRVELLRLSEDHHVLVFAVHHIVFDGWSAQVLLNELADGYAAHTAGTTPTPAPLELTVGEHMVRHETRFAPGAPERAAEAAHWRRVLDGASRLELPTDRVRPEQRTFDGHTLTLDVEPATTQGVRTLAGDCGVTPFTVLATAFAVVLAQLSGQRDVLFGVPLAGRADEDSTKLIGFLVNVLPLRADLTGVRSFADALDRLRQPALDLLTHQEFPFSALVDELQPERTGNRNPFFDVCFQYLPSPDAGLRFGDVDVELMGGRRPSAQFDLSCDVHDHGDRLTVALEYSTEVFTRRTASLVHELLAATLQSAVADPTAALMPSAHPVTALTSGEPMDAQWRPGGLRALVAERAAERPDTAALIMGADTLTYRELDQRASRLAAQLAHRGVRAGDRVGVLLERSVDLPVALLAVLQCGAAYVPLDPLTPTSRAKGMLAQAGCALLLVHPQTRAFGATLGPALVEIGPDAEADGVGLPAPSAERAVRRGDPAYLIFTSGSSGRPKAVLVPQQAALTLAAGAARTYELSAGDRVLQMASAAVDVSVEEFFGAWHAGACVVMHAPAHEDLEELIRRREVAVLNLPASRWHEWTADLAARGATVPGCVRLVVAGSERVDPARVRTWRSGPGRGVRLLNAYGTTEASVSSVWYDTEHLERDADFTRNVPIGGPLPHVRLYVLDAVGRPVPEGAPGELYIAGPGVGIGYLGDGATTADRFLPDPFGGEPGARMYRTGDQVRRLTSGALDYLGRRDTQVKVRGSRIDLAEVERTAVEVAGVADFVAAVRPDQHGAARLIGYVKAAEDADGALEEARVEQWRSLHDLDAYHEAGTDRADFNTSGWISSYTQEPIPRADMKEWLDATVERILDRPAERVLEIGCGTGMILLRVAPTTTRYVGTDIAAGALAYVTGQLASAGLADGRVRLVEAAAHDFGAVGEELFDLIVINSVAQYFPDLAYLERVLEGAWRRLRPGGRIFLGDIRDVSTLEAFHLSVREARGKEAGASAAEVAELVEADSELCVHPGWFGHFAGVLPGATVVTEVKRGRADTEMNRFRYDVSLWRDRSVSPGPRPVRREGPVTAQEFGDLLDGLGDGGLLLSAVPDARSYRDVVLAARLKADGSSTGPVDGAGDLPHPDDLREAAYARGCLTSIRPQGNGLLTVLVRSAGAGNAAPWPTDEPVPVPVAANQPLRAARNRGVIAAVREHLTSHLPSAMVPTRFVSVEEIPLSVSGKVDRARLPDPGQSSDTSGRVAARTGAEVDLCAIWAEALGLDEVGIRDNFFEVGGDSITWLQIMSRGIRSGYRLGARDVFDHQTVEQLARLLADRDRTAPDTQSLQAGAERPVSAALTPIQHWFFEAFEQGRHHQNQYQWYELTAGNGPDLFERALRTVVEHHDGLLSHFTLLPEGARQHRATEGAPARLPVREVDITSVAADRRTEVLRRESDRAQASLHIADGPLFSVVVFRTPDDEPDIVFWCVHHLVVDAVSWQFLTEDLDTALAALAAHDEPVLPPRSGDALVWARWSQEEADRLSDEELQHWRSTTAAPAFELPVCHAEQSPLARDGHLVARTIRVPGPADRSGEAMLAGCLAALRPVLAEQADTENGTVWLEFHGRPLMADAPDMARSVGWFTALFPFLLTAQSDSAGIRGRLASVPHGGVGYGRARHLRGEHLTTGANVVVNYLGPAAISTRGRLSAAPQYAEISGPVADADAVIPFAAEINIALDRDGSLTVRAHLGARYFDEAAAHAFADRIATQLEAELAGAVADPADLADDGFALLPDSVQALEYATKLRQRPDVVAAYGLSPMQRTMLYRHLIDASVDVNYNDFTLTLSGPLDLDLFRDAWRALGARHEVLRTSFEWEGTGGPVQLVHRAVPELRVLDWSGTEAAEAEERLARLRHAERAAPPPLKGAPPFRLTLVTLGPDSHRLLWCDHHILLDGWSSGILVRELTAAYAELAAGRRPFGSSAAPVRYRDYLSWLRQRSGVEASAYWRTELADFDRATPLPFDVQPSASVAGAGDFHEVAADLDDELLAGLRRRAEQDHSTLGALFQAAWAALLHRQTGSERVVFGVAQSGRPAELGDVGSMVGMYMMTLPLVARVDAAQSLTDLLGQVSKQGWRLMSLAGHGSLWDVHDWAGIPVSRALFHSALVVQNFGVVHPADSLDLPVRAELAPTRTVTGFPLTVVVDPSSGTLRMIADGRCFAKTTVRQLLDAFEVLLRRTVSGPVDRIGDLPSLPITRGTVAAPPLRRDDDPPRGATETRVAGIWRSVLGIEQVNRDVNLFDSGATSLSAALLHSKLCAEFDVELPITDVFRCPTVSSMAAMLDGLDGDKSIRTAAWVARNDRRRQALQVSFHRARPGRRAHDHQKGKDA